MGEGEILARERENSDYKIGARWRRGRRVGEMVGGMGGRPKRRRSGKIKIWNRRMRRRGRGKK